MPSIMFNHRDFDFRKLLNVILSQELENIAEKIRIFEKVSEEESFCSTSDKFFEGFACGAFFGVV